MTGRATGPAPAAHQSARRHRSLALVGVGLALLPLLAAGGPAASAAAATRPGVRVAVDTLAPAVGRPGSLLQVAGTVRVTGTEPVRAARVRLRLSETPLGSRTELAAVLAGKVASRDGTVVVEAALGDLTAGSVTAYDLRRPLDAVAQLTGFGVYVLGVEVVGRAGSASDPAARLGLARSLLPWAPAKSGLRPTGFNWLWPLVATPVRLADGTFANDALAAELRPGGRLDRLLRAGAALDQGAALTWAIDPELVETVADMADQDGYQVRAGGGATVAGSGSLAAASWLAQLRVATAGAAVVPLPYADPDPVTQVRHGALDELAAARSTGSTVLAALLPAALQVPELAWPVEGYLDRPTLRAVARDGVSAVVLDGRALPTTLELSYTPTGLAQLATPTGRLAGLLADPGLVDLLARAGPTDPAPVLTAQRIVAETAMIAAELPSSGPGRTVVAMPPRRWAPPQTFLDQLVALAAAPWAAPVSLRELAATQPPEVDRAGLRYPRSQRRAELPESYLLALDTFDSATSVLASILADPGRLVPGLRASRARAASSWWGRQPEARVNRLSLENDYLSTLRSSVRVQPGSFTFGSRTGKIPITLVNELPATVSVVLRLRAQTPRLSVQAVTVPPIGPNQKVQVEVPATAVAGGPVVVDATLFTPQGAQLGQTVPLRVNVTEIGAVALVITVAAGVVLLAAAGVRLLRRIRASRADGTPDGAPASTR